MLFILFQIGSERYAVEARSVVEVLPLMEIRRLPQAPPAIAGVLNYRGVPLPVIDLSQVMLGESAVKRLSTRIIVVQAGGKQVGLIAERTNATLTRELTDFAPTGVDVNSTPYLGSVARDSGGFIQRLLPEELVNETLAAPLAALT